MSENKYDPEDIKIDSLVNRINWRLADRQNLSLVERQLLEKAYNELSPLLKRPELYATTGEEAVELVRHYQAILQFLWKFDINPNMHYYEFMLEGCTCPFEDNYERSMVSSYERVYSSDCKFHGINKQNLL